MSSNQLLGHLAGRTIQEPRNIEDVDRLTGRDFEFFAAKLLQSQGYRIVQVTPPSGDLGTDIVAEWNGTRYSVQVKCWSRWVSPDAVREALHGKEAYRCDAAMVVANRKFMPYTKSVASQTGCILVGRDVLTGWVQAYAQRRAYLARLREHQREQVSPVSTYVFVVGQQVKHSIFGEGQVLEVAPSGQDQIVTVQFNGAGKKRLMAKAAKLEPLG